MWSRRFEDLVRMHLLLADEQPLAPDTPLADHGLDSMRTVGLLVDLEQAYGVTFTNDMLVPETFATASTVWHALSTLVEGCPR
jgi:acyl carrier protein